MAKRKRVTKKRVKPVKRKAARRVVKRPVVKKKVAVRKNASFYKSKARKQYETRLGELMVRQFKTSKKSARRKIGKSIQSVKAQLRKLS